MIKVIPLSDNYAELFGKLFKLYYRELGCGDDTERLISDYILPDLLAGLLKTDVLFEGDELAGFVIYQRDDIDSDWNFKEGWGDIRELYVAPPFRRKGLGKFLLFTAEMKLREDGVQRAYCLPAQYSIPFFTACGYAQTDEYCDDLDCPVFVKLDLNNCCK